MKAFIVDRYGSADRARASEVPDPEMREDDVLIEIHAGGVNLLDSKIRNGEFKLLLPYRLPLSSLMWGRYTHWTSSLRE
jgi:NADPH:quinone reductase-like Zn-dependent oxidoreductase